MMHLTQTTVMCLYLLYFFYTAYLGVVILLSSHTV